MLFCSSQCIQKNHLNLQESLKEPGKLHCRLQLLHQYAQHSWRHQQERNIQQALGHGPEIDNEIMINTTSLMWELTGEHGNQKGTDKMIVYKNVKVLHIVLYELAQKNLRGTQKQVKSHQKLLGSNKFNWSSTQLRPFISITSPTIRAQVAEVLPWSIIAKSCITSVFC